MSPCVIHRICKALCFQFHILPATLLNCSIHLPLLSDTTQTVPAVVSCVRAIVTKSTNSLLVHLVSMVMGWQAAEEPSGALFKRNVPESVLAKIPKEWNYTPLEAKGKEPVPKSMHRLGFNSNSALYFFFQN